MWHRSTTTPLLRRPRRRRLHRPQSIRRHQPRPRPHPLPHRHQSRSQRVRRDNVKPFHTPAARCRWWVSSVHFSWPAPSQCICSAPSPAVACSAFGGTLRLRGVPPVASLRLTRRSQTTRVSVWSSATIGAGNGRRHWKADEEDGMRLANRVFSAMSLASMLAAFSISSLGAADGPKLARTPDGHPDLQGNWNNSTQTPLQRPAALGTKQFYTDEELAKLRLRDHDTDALANGDPGTYNQFWWEEGGLLKQTSLIVDPPDGRIPPLTPEGERRRAALRARGDKSD